jgi:hypothetical protein
MSEHRPAEEAMTIINDYLFAQVADQRQHDLVAEAANRRLVRIARQTTEAFLP